MRVVSVNVGQPTDHEWLGSTVRTAIFNTPVGGRVRARGRNLDGDEQAYHEVHGGAEKAVYAYAAEDADWWAAQLGRGLEPGVFGENLTMTGVQVTDAAVGERWRVGTTLLEVRQPRIPCAKLGLRMGDRLFPRRFAAAGRPGAYLAILEEGDLGAGDTVIVEHRPDHDVSVGLMARAYHTDRALRTALLAAPELPADWREWALEGVR